MRTLFVLLLSLMAARGQDFIDVEALPERIYWLESGGERISNEFQSLGDAPSMLRIFHTSQNGVEVRSRLSGLGLVDLEGGWDRVSLYPQTASHHHAHADLFLAAHKSADGEFGGLDADDIIRVDSGATARISSPVRCRALAIKGTLSVDIEPDEVLECETILVYPSGHLSIVSGTISFTGSIAHDPSQRSVGLVSMGQVTIHGGDPNNFAELTQDSTTTLSGDFTGWNVGDTIAFPDMQAVPYSTYQMRTYRPMRSQAETAQIVRIDGDQITIHPPLQYDHRDTQTGLVPVGNLNNKITFETKPGSIVRAHSFFSCHHVPVRIQGATFKNMGRTSSTLITPNGGLNQIGLYGLHAHDCDDFVFEGVVVWGDPPFGASPRHAIVHHNSHGIVKDCLVVSAMSSGIFGEEGGETGTWQGNTVFADCYGSSLNNDVLGINSGKELGAGGFHYWSRIHNIELIGNRAYGFSLGAYASFTHNIHRKKEDVNNTPNNPNDDVLIPQLPLVFKDNYFHGSAEGSLRLAYDDADHGITIENFNAWNRMKSCEGVQAVHCLDFLFKGGSLGADQGRYTFLNVNGLDTSKLRIEGLTRKGSWQFLSGRFNLN